MQHTCFGNLYGVWSAHASATAATSKVINVLVGPMVGISRLLLREVFGTLRRLLMETAYG